MAGVPGRADPVSSLAMAEDEQRHDEPGDPPGRNEVDGSAPGGVEASELPKWARLHLWQMQPVRDVLVVLAVLVVLWLGKTISVVTVPLLLAILLAYLFEPVIQWLMARTRLSRSGAVSAIIGGTVVLVVVPSALGITYGVAQGAGLVATVVDGVATTYESVQDGRRVAPVDADAATDEGAGDDAPPVPATPSPEVEALQARADASRAKVRQLGGPWLWIRDRLVESGEGHSMQEAFDTVAEWTGQNADRVATAGAGAIRSALGFVGNLFGIAFMGFVTAFFFFFIATSWVQFKGFAASLIPDRDRDLILDLLVKFDAVISAFIRGRLTIAFVQSIVFTGGYFVIGVPAAFILGPIVALLSIVPYLALVGVPISVTLLALEAHAGVRGTWWWILGAPTAFYFLAQALDDYVWTPWIQGKSTDMSTPMILFASLAGGVLFGVFGLLIAIPIAACVKIVIQEVFWPRFKDWAEGRAEDFLPLSRG